MAIKMGNAMNYVPVMRRYLLPLFITLYFVSSIYVMIPFMAGCVSSGYSGLDSGPYGIKSRPVIYRVLIPALAKMTYSIIPEAIEEPLTKILIHWRDSGKGKKTIASLFLLTPPLSDDEIFETAVTAFISYLTLLAFIWMLYTLARALFPESSVYALYAPLIALQFLLALTVKNSYIYDFAELFFSCALFYLLFKQRWALYLITFIFATLNKETTIFALFFYMTWFYSRLPRRKFLQLLLAQGVVYAAIKGGLTLYFASYPGTLIGPPLTLAGNLEALFHRGDYIYFVLAILFMVYRWREKPALLRGALPMLLAHATVFFVLCLPGEYRDFYWSLPIMILLVTHSLVADDPLFKCSKGS